MGLRVFSKSQGKRASAVGGRDLVEDEMTKRKSQGKSKKEKVSREPRTKSHEPRVKMQDFRCQMSDFRLDT